MSEYYFQVNVREGAPGFADNSEYKSRAYSTLAEAYRSLCDFIPARHWTHLRRVSRMNIWRDGNEEVDVSTRGDYAIAVTDLVKLNSSKEEFEAIIDENESYAL